MAVHRSQSSQRKADVRQGPWWSSAVIYQIYVRSFCDSNGDGIGDIQGVTSRLDYLARLGVDGIWPSPVTVSANYDWGYDVVDYRAVQPELGSLDDLDRLVSAAGTRGIRVLLDLVPNHTSSLHPWFVEARSSRASQRRDWYLWADPLPGGGPPNNWLSIFGGPAWTLDEHSGQYYMHNFLPCQPDLNWWNPEVRKEFEGILRFWFDRGIAGFRIDVAHALVKDQLLRDQPPASDRDHPFIRKRLQQPTYSMNRPEVHEIYREWRRLADSYASPRLLLGETFVLELAQLFPFYGTGDELQLAFNFPFALAPFSGSVLSGLVDDTLGGLPERSTPVWMSSNHDVGRLATRWAEGDERRVRLALFLLMTLPGTACLYAGDEIGLPEGHVPPERLLDPVGLAGWPDDPGRDRMRTPMIWNDEPGHGFTADPLKAWLPFGPAPLGSVEEQVKREDSVFALVRRLIQLRHSWPCLASGRYEALPRRGEVWAWSRTAEKDGVVGIRLGGAPRACVVAANFSDEDRDVDVAARQVVLSTLAGELPEVPSRRFARRRPLRLAPWEGVIVLP